MEVLPAHLERLVEVQLAHRLPSAVVVVEEEVVVEEMQEDLASGLPPALRKEGESSRRGDLSDKTNQNTDCTKNNLNLIFSPNVVIQFHLYHYRRNYTVPSTSHNFTIL